MSLVSSTHTGFSYLALFSVFKDIFMSKAISYYKLLLLFVSALDSSDEMSKRILDFFDSVIIKMRTFEEDIVPLESCQCEETLEVVIMPLAHHFLALGEHNKALYYFLEIASAYLILEDNYMVSRFCPAVLHPWDHVETGDRGQLSCAFCDFMFLFLAAPLSFANPVAQ